MARKQQQVNSVLHEISPDPRNRQGNKWREEKSKVVDRKEKFTDFNNTESACPFSTYRMLDVNSQTVSLSVSTKYQAS